METEYLDKLIMENIGNDIPLKDTLMEVSHSRDVFRYSELKYHKEEDVKLVIDYVKQMYKSLK